jgi:hypothetical protein
MWSRAFREIADASLKETAGKWRDTTAAPLKGYRTPRTPADTNRARGSDGRRPRSPIRLEGGNHGKDRDGAGAYGDLSIARARKSAA